MLLTMTTCSFFRHRELGPREPIRRIARQSQNSCDRTLSTARTVGSLGAGHATAHQSHDRQALNIESFGCAQSLPYRESLKINILGKSSFGPSQSTGRLSAEDEGQKKTVQSIEGSCLRPLYVCPIHGVLQH
jgi:hypothetical protein